MRIYSCIPAFLHVEHVGQDIVLTEVEEAEVEGPEQQLQESEVAEEDQVTTTDFANPNLKQGKHRFIYPSVLHKFKFMQAPDHLKPSVHTFEFKFYFTQYIYALSL